MPIKNKNMEDSTSNYLHHNQFSLCWSWGTKSTLYERKRLHQIVHVLCWSRTQVPNLINIVFNDTDTTRPKVSTFCNKITYWRVHFFVVAVIPCEQIVQQPFKLLLKWSNMVHPATKKKKKKNTQHFQQAISRFFPYFICMPWGHHHLCTITRLTNSWDTHMSSFTFSPTCIPLALTVSSAL